MRRISLGGAVVMIALIMLVVGVQGLVWAQSPQGTTGSGGCVPGSSYHSDCDVNQDGKIDVQDLQLVATHWKQTGTPNGHFGETWSGDLVGAGLAVDNSNLFGTGLWGEGTIGVRGKGGLQGVYGEGLWGVYGSSPVTNSTQAYGVYGETKSAGDGAAGVYGVAITTTGKVYGVYGETKSISDGSAGVYGLASAPASASGGVVHGVYGVYGETRESGMWDEAAGVYGVFNASSGIGSGVRGENKTPGGYGVYGQDSSGSGYAGRFKGRVLVERSILANAGDPANHVMVVENPGIGGDGPDVLALVSGDIDPDAKSNFITFFGQQIPQQGNTLVPVAIGAVEGNGSGGVVYKSGGGDFAEMLAAVDGLEPGDVLVIGPDGKLTRSTRPYQASVAGVYSTAPAVLGSAVEDEEGKAGGKVPLAIMGVVPVKASAENGPIRPGDLLTAASKPGHAMRADPIVVNGVRFYPSGVIIGKALEGLEKGTGVIRMLVMLQ